MKSQPLAQPTLVGKYDIDLHGEIISYTLKRSSRAKLIWLGIKRQSGLTVTIPHNYPVRDLPGYLNSNSRWILRNIAKYCHEIDTSPVSSIHTDHSVSYLGKILKVTQNRTGNGLNQVKLEGKNLVVSLNSSGNAFSSQELERWLKIQAARMINLKVEEFSRQMHLLYNRVVIRNQKSRWGSCSRLRNLNFNWRLIMAPEPVLDYVIIHELCHLKEMSHSKSFWNLVARYCPRWREHRNWLDTHCLELNAQIQF